MTKNVRELSILGLTDCGLIQFLFIFKFPVLFWTKLMKFTGFQRSIVWIQGFQAPQGLFRSLIYFWIHQTNIYIVIVNMNLRQNIKLNLFSFLFVFRLCKCFYFMIIRSCGSIYLASFNLNLTSFISILKFLFLSGFKSA